MRVLRTLVRLILPAIVGILWLPASAFSQASITGVVTNIAGTPIPGATVEVSSPGLKEKVRTAATDDRGRYRIAGLPPGIYAVTVAVPGFTTLRRDEIALTGPVTVTVDAQLRVAVPVIPDLVATGVVPTVDMQSVAQQRVFEKDVVDALPAGRNHASLAILIPGTSGSQPERAGNVADVGGTSSLQATWMSIHGGRQSDMRVLVDGVNIRNLTDEGQSTNFVPDLGSTKELTVDYAAGTAEWMLGGLRIDHTPREGANSFRGSIFATGVNSRFQGDNFSDDLRSRGLGSPNELKLTYDVNASGGGPLVQDRLWFYASARSQANESYVPGVYGNRNAGNPNAWLYAPDFATRSVSSLTQDSGNARLTWQASPKNKINLTYDQQRRVWDDGRPGVSPESITRYRFPRKRIVTAGWTAPISNQVLIEAKAANHAEEYSDLFPGAGDPYRTLIPVTEQSTGLLYRGRGVANFPAAFQSISAPNINEAKASLSWVTAAHAFKVGVTDLWGDQTDTSRDNDSSLSYRFSSGIPNLITQRATPYTSVTRLKAELGAYVQDRWTLNRLTVNAGVRFDYFSTEFPEQQVGPGTLAPDRNLTFPRTTFYDYKDISPRVGVAYDLSGDGRTAIKVSLNEYVVAVDPTLGNPVSGLATSASRSWNDANRNYSPDCVLTNPLANGECGLLSNLAFGGVRSGGSFDPAIISGWHKRPNNWELTASVQRELAPRVALDIGYFRRWFGNFLATDNRAVAPTDYNAYSITVPRDARLPDGGGYVVSGLHDIVPSKFGVVDNYTTFASNFGRQIEHWNGVDATVNARPRDGVLLQGGFSTGRTTTDNCEVVAKTDNPSQLYCHVETNFLSQVKLLGTYTWPKPDIRLSATFQSTPGPAIAANYIVSNAQVQSSLRRPLSGSLANVTVNIVEPGTMYGERANQLDLRVSKLFRFGRTRTAVNFDLNNALNTAAVLAQNNNYGGWLIPQRVVGARLMKISANLDF